MKKKIIVFICVIVVAMTTNSCKKRTYYYYGYCDKGHTLWEGTKREYPANGSRADTKRMEAEADASDHDKSVHGGVHTAEVRHGMY